MMGRFVALLALGSMAAVAVSVEVSPVEKVITLLEDLKTETEDEGKAEATTYDEFACFCKSTTEEKTDAIKEDQDAIEGLAATLQEQTEIKNAKAHEIKELDAHIAKIDKDMAYITARREKEATRYEAQSADLSKGCSSLEGAITDLEAAAPPASLAEVKASVRRSLVIAEVLNLAPEHQKALTNFLQEDPETPAEGEEGALGGSSDIFAVLESLTKHFKARKSQLDQLEAQNKADFNAAIEGKNEEKRTVQTTKENAESEKSTAEANIATASDETILEEAKLKDDETYMKDLTAKCEQKAREWDQRSQMRADEVSALTQALAIIKNKAQENYEEAGGTRLLQSQSPELKAAIALRTRVEEDSFGDMGLSFVEIPAPRKKLHLLAKAAVKAAASAHTLSAAAMAERQSRVQASLMLRGQSLGSPSLTALALRVGADPFAKVKKLVQELIERLVKEAAEEATKQGWCNTEMGKATQNRNLNMNRVMKVNTAIQAAEAKKAELEQDITTLTEEIAELNEGMTKQTKIRSDEKAENMDTLDKAKAGLAAVKDAKKVLEAFYKKAAKAAALVQVSPVDEDAPSGGPSGSYKGGQQRAGGIVAMLDVIISDFQKSIQVTADAEKDAHREFVEFSRTTKASLTEKEAGKSQAELDLKATDQKIAEDMDDLSAHQKVLDDALKTLEDLKPACVDTGMSYADRVAKREEEIAALKKAMCELDADKVEAECQ